MIGIYTHPHGISLNGREWALLGKDVALFDTTDEAVKWLNKQTGESKTQDEWEENDIHIGDYQ